MESMDSNNSSITGSSNFSEQNEYNMVDDSEVAKAERKGVTEMGATCETRNENLSTTSTPADYCDGQPEASTNHSVQVLHAQPLSSSCTPPIKMENETKAADKPAEIKTSIKEGAMNTNMIMSETGGVDCTPKSTKREDVCFDDHSHPIDMYANTEQEHESPAVSYASQQVSPFPGTVIQPSLIALSGPGIPIQPRYLRRDEYLAAVMTCIPADFTNPRNPVIQDAFTYGKYEHLLGYINALDDAGQISTAQEVIILATAQCFRPLGLLLEIDQSFALTASILRHCHSFARGQLLRFLQTMIERAPAAFIPRGEAFVPILDGFGAVLESYSGVLPLAMRARVESCENRAVILERWRIERENSALALSILLWSARQPAHWASMNGSHLLLTALYGLVTEPGLDRGVHGMIIDFIALNVEFLPSLDMCIPQNVVLDTILSTLEHAAGREISSLQYPEYMTMIKLIAIEAEPMLSACLTILYHYSCMIPRESLVLSRFVGIITELIGDEWWIRYRSIICCTMKRLFERFPDEFDVCEEFVKKLGELLDDEICRDGVLCVLRIIQERCRNREEGMTN